MDDDLPSGLRTIGAPGANSTFTGSGMFWSSGIGTLGTAPHSRSAWFSHSGCLDCTGLWMGKTLTVAGSITTKYACFQSLN